MTQQHLIRMLRPVRVPFVWFALLMFLSGMGIGQLLTQLWGLL